MKIIRRELAPQPPPREYVLTLSEEEARLMEGLARYNISIPQAVGSNHENGWITEKEAAELLHEISDAFYKVNI